MRITKAVLIVGGSGFLGTHLALRLRESYKVFATYYKHPMSMSGVTYLPFNIDNRNWVKRVLYTIQPDVIIYAAGHDSPEWASKNERRATIHHEGGPAALSSTTDVLQPKFIYLSNPFVFDGSRGNYHENDTVLPGNSLGKMKIGGENIIRSKYLNYIILRSSPLLGRGNGFSFSAFDQLRIQLDRNIRCDFSEKEIHSFAPVFGLCDLVVRLVDSGIKNRVIHYGGLTKLSYYEFAKAFAKHFKYNPELIAPKAQIFKDSGYEEPTLDYSLNSSHAIETLKVKSFLLEECFDLIQKQLIPL